MSVDFNRARDIIKSGSLADLIRLRTDLNTTKKEIEAQLADDKLGYKEDCTELMAQGMSFREANIKAQATSDLDWRNRASKTKRELEAMFSKINARIHELNGGASSAALSAVTIMGAGQSGTKAAEALNKQVNRKVVFIGTDNRHKRLKRRNDELINNLRGKKV